MDQMRVLVSEAVNAAMDAKNDSEQQQLTAPLNPRSPITLHPPRSQINSQIRPRSLHLITSNLLLHSLQLSLSPHRQAHNYVQKKWDTLIMSISRSVGQVSQMDQLSMQESMFCTRMSTFSRIASKIWPSKEEEQTSRQSLLVVFVDQLSCGIQWN